MMTAKNYTQLHHSLNCCLLYVNAKANFSPVRAIKVAHHAVDLYLRSVVKNVAPTAHKT